MSETMYFYLFEKLVFFLDVLLLGLSSNLTPEALFWAHNAIMLLQAIGRMCFYSLIIDTPYSKMNSVQPASSGEPKFYVLRPQILEPRRPSLLEPRRPSNFLEPCRPSKFSEPQRSSIGKHCKSSLHYHQQPSNSKRIAVGCKRKDTSIGENHFLGQPGPSRASTGLPSVEC